LIRSFQPDVMLIGFCGLLPPEFLRQTSCPIFNMHPGINPRYRGWGNLWAFYENEFGLAGYTVHRVDDGIDTGERMTAAPAPPRAGMSFDGYGIYVAEAGARAAADLALNAAPRDVPAEFRELRSVFYGLPTWSDYRRARRNYEARYLGGGGEPGMTGEK